MPARRPNRTLGPGNDIFWQWCEKEELHLPRCTQCATLAWPIEKVCTTCDNESFVWERLSGHGTIVSWCTFERDYYQGQFPIPWDCVLVELEEGPLFIGNPDALTIHDMRVDLPVRVAFLDCEDDVGLFKLPVFRAGDSADALPPKNLPPKELMP